MEAERARNWWKIGFFVLLVVVEFERELLVVATNEARPLVSKSLYTFGNVTIAEGQWVRADGGDKLTPQGVRYECQRDEGTCYLASYVVYDEFVHRPEFERLDAEFSENSITMTSKGDCVTTVTRIDLATQEAVQTRVKTDGWRESYSDYPELLQSCAILEDRMVARLSGYDDPSLEEDPLEGHFVPLVSMVGAFF